MLDALRQTGWRNYSLFLCPDGLLVGHLECDDFAGCRAAMKEHAVNAPWPRRRLCASKRFRRRFHRLALHGGSMKSFSSLRRDFLRTGGLGLAGISLPSLTLAAPGPHGPAPQQPVFNVRSYGAKGDGKTVDTTAVNRAIEAALEAGGGIIFFPVGTYLCFSIHLKSYVHRTRRAPCLLAQ
jgi:hypothetical protein